MSDGTAFVGRERELAALTRALTTPQPALVVVYGRRRVGKSTLVRHALRRSDAVYYQATRVADVDNQELFKRAVALVTGDDPTLAGLGGWESLLHHLAQWAARRAKGLVVVLDEFPYLCEGNRALPSIVQKAWDSIRERRIPLILVLCGSRISFMETLLAERNPLHGRQSAEFVVQPLNFREAAVFVPRWPVEDRLRLYGVFGGMPYYLSLLDPAASLAANIHRLLLDEGAPLREEPTHLLQAELNQIARYASILRAIADGCTQLKDIAGRVLAAGESGSALSPYLATLQGLRLVNAVYSMDARDPGRQRNTRYYIDDPFLAFHYRFVLPNLSAIQAGHGRAVYRNAIAPRMDEYMGDWFEVICRQWARFYGAERLPAVVQDVGKIWTADYDIDIAGRLLNGRGLAGECKWRRASTGASDLSELRRRVAENAFYADRTGQAVHVVFSRSPATPELRRLAAADGSVVLLGPSDLVGARRKKRRRGRPTRGAA
jgi:AAA+ ATPase superfamily predicted ATPase